MRAIRFGCVLIGCGLILLGGRLSAQEPAPPAPPANPPIITQDDLVILADDSITVRPWGAFATQTGPGVGYDTSYSTLQGFIPLLQDDRNLLFADLRGIVDNTDALSANLGGGYRYYSSVQDRIWGSNVYFDYRDTGEHAFNQVGFGFESLGRWWDARANVYLVTSRDQAETGAFFDNPAFVQHFIQLDRVGIGQGAMSGFDAEVGVPISCRLGLKAYVGAYDFQVRDSEQAWGFKTRLEERLTDNIDFDLSYSTDQVFGNSVVFSARFRFGGRSSREGSSRCDVYARRADPVERNEQIVVTNQVITTHQLATDPETGQPIFVEHVASYAAAGGNGTVEHPFMTLAQVQAASAPNNIIFAWANSVFNGQSITLQANQRFLGEGTAHTFTATQGTFLLPGASTLTTPPLIVGSPGNAITLADNNEVSGFTITNAGNDGIFSNTGITRFNINRNSITGSAANGIELDNVNGSGAIVGNTISQNGVGQTATSANNFGGTSGGATGGDGNGSGIVINATSLNVQIAKNVMLGNGMGGNATSGDTGGGNGQAGGNSGGATSGAGNGSGIVINTTILNGSITGNSVEANGAGGFAFSGNSNGGSNANGGSSGGATAGSGNGTGLVVNATNVNAIIANNTVFGNGVGGSATSGSANGGSNASGGNSGGATAGSGSGTGLVVNTTTLTGSITGNNISGNGTGGAALSGNVNGNGTGNGGTSGGTTANTGNGTGLVINATSVNATIANNLTNGNGAGGNATSGSANGGTSGAGGTTGGATAHNGTGTGLLINTTTLAGSVTGNIATTNGNGGSAVSGDAIPGGVVGGVSAGTGIGTGLTINATTNTATISNNTQPNNGVAGTATPGSN